MSKLTLDSRETLYVVRQPILDAVRRGFGYELLYRASAEDGTHTGPMDVAVARALTDAVLNIGFDTLTEGRPAFLNVSGPLLLHEAYRILPPGAAVLQLHGDTVVDADLFEVCRNLFASGYELALGGFVPGSDAEALLPYVRFVKVNVLATTASTQLAVAEYLHSSGIRLVAEGVETAEAFEAARAAGYTLFQGGFFCRPVMCGTAPLPARQLAYLRLLSMLNQPDLTVAEVEDLVKHDVSLSYRVLRCVNSASFGLRREIHSIRQALLLLGVGPIRSWASVWCLAGLNTGGTPELVTTALVRARSCELMAQHVLGEEAASELFLVGLCSLLDAMLGRPMEQAIAELPLSDDAVDALLGHPNIARHILDAAVAYERGAWDEATAAADAVRLGPAVLPDAYTGALRWTCELSRSASPAAPAR